MQQDHVLPEYSWLPGFVEQILPTSTWGCYQFSLRHRGNLLVSFARSPDDLNEADRASRESAFCVASLSKTITAIAVLNSLTLCGRSEHDSVACYLDYLRADRTSSLAEFACVSVEDLLRHESGLRFPIVSPRGYGYPQSAIDYCWELIDGARSTTARKVCHYSNAGYSILARVVEGMHRIMGNETARYEEIVRNVPYIKAIRSEGSAVFITGADCFPPVQMVNGRFELIRSDSALPCLDGASSWAMSADSVTSIFGKYLDAEDGDELGIRKALLRKIRTGTRGPDTEIEYANDWRSGSHYCLGCHVVGTSGSRFKRWYHVGEWTQYQSFYSYRKDGLIWAINCNHSPSSMPRLFQHVFASIDRVLRPINPAKAP